MSVKASADVFECGGLPVNCRIYRGELIPSLSPVLQGGGVPDGIIYACHSDAVNRFFVCTQTDVYASAGGTNFVRLNSLKGNTPFLIEQIEDGKARAVVINGGNTVIHTGEGFMGHAIDIALSCGVMRCGRIFGADATDGLKIIWTDGEGFGFGGSVTLDPERGVVLDIAELGEKLVIIRKYGLTTANMFGSTENFSVDEVSAETDEIIRGTAAVVNNLVIFCTVSGLYSFDGSSVKRITHRCSEDVCLPTAAVAFNGGYYLSCYSKFLDREVVLCYDPSDGESFLIDICAQGLCAADGVYAFNQSGAYRLETGGEYSYYSSAINFGGGGYKTVTGAFFDCGGVTAQISNGRVERGFISARGSLRPRLRGKSFSVKVQGAVPVGKIILTAEARDEI